MKRNNQSLWLTLCAAAALTVAAGCSQDEMVNAPAPVQGNVTLSAGFEGAGGNTRTSILNDQAVVWNDGDAFELFYTATTDEETETQAEGTITSATFTEIDADGTKTTAKFQGTIEGGFTPSYAVYPSVGENKPTLSDKTVTVTLPATIDAAIYSTCPMPMFATVSNLTDNLQFMHLAGALKLTVDRAQLPSDAVTLVVEASLPIAGEFTADLSAQTPELKTTTEEAAPAAEDGKTVTITISNTNLAATVFYIPVPTGTYATITATLKSNEESDNDIATKTWTNVTVGRASLLRGTFGAIEVEATKPADVTSALEGALPAQAPTEEKTTNVSLTGKIDATQEGAGVLVIPAVANSNVNTTFTLMPTTSSDAPLKIQEKTEAFTEASKEAVNTNVYTFPAKGDSQNGLYLNFDTPSSTTVIEASGESTEIDQVTAKTAINTFVIGSGVTVKRLIVAGGNVKVLKGGTLSAIEKAEGNDASVIYVIAEESATIPNLLGESFKKVSQQEFNLLHGYPITAQLDYKLEDDLTLDKTTVVESTVTIDLNGHTLSTKATAFDVKADATLTIKDSSNGDTKGMVNTFEGSTEHGLAVNTMQGKLTVTGGRFTDPKVLTCRSKAMVYVAKNAVIKVQMKADNDVTGFDLGNGEDITIDMENHKLTLSDPRVGSSGTETNSCRLLQQGKALTFLNGEIYTSNNDGIAIQNYGNLTLQRVKLNAPYADYGVSNNQGNILIDDTEIIAANVSFDVCGFSTYKNGVTVTVKGNSIIKNAVEISRSSGNTEELKLNIEGGTFNGKLILYNNTVTAEEAKDIITITGNPTFTDSSWDAYKNKTDEGTTETPEEGGETGSGDSAEETPAA